MRNLGGPFPTPGFNKMTAANGMYPASAPISGELKKHIWKQPIGAAMVSGRISDVWLSVGASGKDDTNALQFEADVFINGVSCLTTKPKIAHVSGETSQQKTTKVTGDTGITQSVVNTGANYFDQGDVFTFDFELTRTATPTTEISSPVIVVEFEPII